MGERAAAMASKWARGEEEAAARAHWACPTGARGGGGKTPLSRARPSGTRAGGGNKDSHEDVTAGRQRRPGVASALQAVMLELLREQATEFVATDLFDDASENAYGDCANMCAAGEVAASRGSAERPWLLPEPRVRYAAATCSGKKPASA